MKFKQCTIFFLLVFSAKVFSQDDLLALADNGKPTHEKVFATFKGTKIVNAQTTETVKAKTMEFNITHRFGNIGAASNGGGHTLYGLDNVSDVRFGFNFGLTDNLTIGIGRSKQYELIDGIVKYRFLTQTTDNHIPLSIAFYGNMSYNPQKAEQFFGGIDPSSNVKQNDIYRISYLSQLVIARKFGSRFSMELLPTYMHRNYVVGNINPNNDKAETNDLMALGGGFRLKITKRIAIVADYFYTFSDYRKNNSTNPYYNPLAVGVEIETGGHVFHLDFTNASGIVENNFIPYTSDSWAKGGYKFGFNISRVFNLPHKRKSVN